MKIMITGGSGLLGQYLNLAFSKDHEILTLYNNSLGNVRQFRSAKVDLSDLELLKKITEEFDPEIIVHTAAISRPESAKEMPRKIVDDINVNSSKVLAEFCEKRNSKIIYTSTDLVYDGDQGEYISEEGTINPVSVYAETKLNGEMEIKNSTENYVILRTSLLFGIGLNHSVNNYHLMYKNFMEGKKVKLFYDQFRTPLELFDASELILKIAESDVKKETFNFGGKQRVSRAELGEILCEEAGFDKNLIEQISMENVTSIKKVRDVSMSTGKLNSSGFHQKSLRESVRQTIIFAKNVF